MVDMRERIRNNDGPLEAEYKTLYIKEATCPEAASGVTTHTSDAFLSLQDNSIMHDVVTPDYKRISGQGGIVNSPMDQTRTILRDNPAFSTHDYQWEFRCPANAEHEEEEWHGFVAQWQGIFPSTDWCSWSDLPPVPSYDEQALIDYAVTKAWSNVDLSEVQSLVMLGESEKTVSSVISIFTRFIKIVKAIKRADLAFLKRQITRKELENRYMELRYALRPLMYDVKGVTAAFNTKASQKPKRLTFRGVKTFEDNDTDTDVEHVVFNNFVGERSYDINSEMVSSVEIVVRAGVLTAIENLNTLHVWGALQPIEAIWELVPFSFIVDWFFNVGDTLASFTPNFGTRTLSSWYTVEKQTYQYLGKEYANVSCSETAPANNRWVAWNKTLEGCWIDKTVISTVRVPNPSRSVTPTFNVRMNMLKLADLLIIGKRMWGR